MAGLPGLNGGGAATAVPPGPVKSKMNAFRDMFTVKAVNATDYIQQVYHPDGLRR